MDLAWIDTIKQLPYAIYLKWLMLLVPGVMLFFWQRASHKTFEPYINQPSIELQTALFRMSWMRGWVIVLLWAMLCTTLITYDLRYPLQEQIAEQPVPTVAQTPPPAIASTLKSALSPAEREPYLDLLKSRYEDAFLSFFYLRQCKAAKDEDYQKLYIRFQTQIAAAGADKSLVGDTVSAALGSFETIYSGSSCESKYLIPIEEQFRQMLVTINSAP